MPQDNQTTGLENLLHESRSFPPSPEFSAQANAQPAIYARAAADPTGVWAPVVEDPVHPDPGLV